MQRWQAGGHLCPTRTVLSCVWTISDGPAAGRPGRPHQAIQTSPSPLREPQRRLRSSLCVSVVSIGGCRRKAIFAAKNASFPRDSFFSWQRPWQSCRCNQSMKGSPPFKWGSQRYDMKPEVGRKTMTVLGPTFEVLDSKISILVLWCFCQPSKSAQARVWLALPPARTGRRVQGYSAAQSPQPYFRK